MSEAADNAQAILSFLADRRPATATEIARDLGVHVTTVIYHLRRLAAAQAVVRDGRLWTTPEAKAHRQGLLEDLHGHTRELLALVRAQPLGMDHTQAARSLGLSNAAVTRIVRKLSAQGLVSVTRAGRSKKIHPTRLPAPPVHPATSDGNGGPHVPGVGDLQLRLSAAMQRILRSVPEPPGKLAPAATAGMEGIPASPVHHLPAREAGRLLSEE